MKPPVTDRDTVHLIIYSAVGMALLCLLAAILFVYMGAKDLALVAIGAAVGSPSSLLALLAATNRGPSATPPPGPTVPVKVTNGPHDAIPVEQTPPQPDTPAPTPTTEGETP